VFELAVLPVAAPGLRAWLLAGPKPAPFILLIEDDPTIALMYMTQLTAAGYAAEMAGDVASGMELMRHRRPDLILLDLRLPQIEGFAVLEQVRADPDLQTIPILVLSNFGDPSVVGRAMALGAREYLIKSQTTPPELVQRIRRYVPKPD
jgi:DNA-binding response OmpR family regulator